MNKIVKTNTVGGFPLYDDDIRFLQDSVIGNIENQLAIMYGNCIMYGSGWTGSAGNYTVYSGIINYGGRLYSTSNYLTGVNDINEVYVVDDTTYDSNGDRVFKDGSNVSDIYELNRCMYIISASAPSGYNWYIKLTSLQPVNYQIANKIDNTAYSFYETYKKWINVLFDSDINSAYAFDKLLENNTRIDYNLNLLKPRMVFEATFTYVNAYDDLYQGITIKKDINGYVNISGGFHAVGNDAQQFITSIQAGFTPPSGTSAIGTAVEVGNNKAWVVNVQSSGTIQFDTNPTGNTNTAYAINITYKV